MKIKFSRMLLPSLVLATFVFSVSTFALGLPEEHEATNCAHTGNASDYCYTSSGSQNVRVLECRPGSTDCGYKLEEEEVPTTPVVPE